MAIVILRNDLPEDGRWMHCQYGHHHTCGGLIARHIYADEEIKPACTCDCHENERTAALADGGR